ncbi:peroxiredoxin [Ferrimicrobium sp.]|uniref:peroxiredoxin n=1 Tax=Ferrimicrobium sp. TaxID=2926050 RepID=UPI002639F0E1|nr:peroxiredoxin [Ferrimicrobium sp.]
MSELQLGDVAPEFSLVGTGDRSYALGEFVGRPVVLAFYPDDFSPVCTTQLRAYSASIDDFTELGAVMLGISPQSLDSHESFKDRLGIRFPLLSDRERVVAKAYGVLGPLGFYRRSVFVLDRELRIVYRHVSRAGLTFRSSDELLRAVHQALE